MVEFLKSGDRVRVKPEGLDYILESGKVYTLKHEEWPSETYLELGSCDLCLPEKLFKSESDAKFTQKVLKYFETTARQTTGVLLSGLKGSGKTVMSKVLAFESKLPIVVVDTTFPTRELTTFFSKIKETQCCIIFDEVDKNERYWNTEHLLGFLDGIQSTCKKLVLLTCNSDSKLNEYIMDRCSRVRYYRKFESLSYDSILEIASSILDKDKSISATNFIVDNFKIISYDNVVSFLEEINANEDESFESIIKDLNISIKNVKKDTAAKRTRNESNSSKQPDAPKADC